MIYRTETKQNKMRVMKDMIRKTVKNIERCTFLVVIIPGLGRLHWDHVLIGTLTSVQEVLANTLNS